MRVLLFFFIYILTVSCFEKKTFDSDSGAFLAPKAVAELTDKRLQEVSGLAASANNHAHFWTHNDSGNDAVVYLIDEQLEVKLVCELKGVKNRDWEDIAVGPGPEKGKNYVYVADIGDNNAKHKFKYIYRFEEPVLSGNEEITITQFDTIKFELDGEVKDTEALMIHPETMDLYIVSKREKPVNLYQLTYPYDKSDSIVASKVMTLPFSQIVSAGISTDGNEILMKNYDNIYYWDIKSKTIAEGLQITPQKLKYIEEPQGEAITFSRDGSGFYTLSEKLMGEKTFLYHYARGNP